MFRLVGQRILAVVPLLFIASAATFFLLQLSDVDPAVVRLGDAAPREQYDVVRAELGVDRPAIVQYGDWAGHAIRGDLGESWSRPVPVWDLVRQRIPATLSLAMGALFVAIVIGVPFGVAAGVRSGSTTDRVLTATASIGQAMPAFWIGLVLAAYLAVPYGVFPATGFVGPTASITDWLRSITLPSIALGAASAAAVTRQTRAAVAAAAREPYVRTAVAVGYSRRSVLFHDVLRNAMIPAVTVVGIQATLQLGGSLIVEQVFAIPGLGSLAFSSILKGDVPVVLGVVMLAALFIVFVQLVVDISYAVLDPRVRLA